MQHMGAAAAATTGLGAIVELLATSDDHLTAVDIVEEVQLRHPAVHVSTVYRALGTAQRGGMVVHLHVGHGPTVYHLADDYHGHLVCRRCGRLVIDVPTGVIQQVAGRVARDHGRPSRPATSPSAACAPTAPPARTSRRAR